MGAIDSHAIAKKHIVAILQATFQIHFLEWQFLTMIINNKPLTGGKTESESMTTWFVYTYMRHSGQSELTL